MIPANPIFTFLVHFCLRLVDSPYSHIHEHSSSVDIRVILITSANNRNKPCALQLRCSLEARDNSVPTVWPWTLVVYGNRTKANFPKKMLLLDRIYIRYTIIIAGFRCCARTNNSKAFFHVEHTHTTSVYYLFLHFLSFLFWNNRLPAGHMLGMFISCV